MKRYFKTITAVVLAVLAVAACQKENLGEVAPDGREAEVKLTLTSPQIGTKSYADGKTVNKVFVHVVVSTNSCKPPLTRNRFTKKLTAYTMVPQKNSFSYRFSSISLQYQSKGIGISITIKNAMEFNNCKFPA